MRFLPPSAPPRSAATRWQILFPQSSLRLSEGGHPEHISPSAPHEKKNKEKEERDAYFFRFPSPRYSSCFPFIIAPLAPESGAASRRSMKTRWFCPSSASFLLLFPSSHSNFTLISTSSAGVTSAPASHLLPLSLIELYAITLCAIIPSFCTRVWSRFRLFSYFLTGSVQDFICEGRCLVSHIQEGRLGQRRQCVPKITLSVVSPSSPLII